MLLIKEKNSIKLKNKQLFFPSEYNIQLPELNIMPPSLCECALHFPPCCTKELEMYVCSCAPKPICNCIGSLENVHESMVNMAMKDAIAQQEMANKAKLQVELFQKAQEFAKEIGTHELEAKRYANEVSTLTKKAQYARSMMFQTSAQIKFLSEQISKTIELLNPSLVVNNNINNKKAILQNIVPQKTGAMPIPTPMPRINTIPNPSLNTITNNLNQISVPKSIINAPVIPSNYNINKDLILLPGSTTYIQGKSFSDMDNSEIPSMPISQPITVLNQNKELFEKKFLDNDFQKINNESKTTIVLKNETNSTKN